MQTDEVIHKLKNTLKDSDTDTARIFSLLSDKHRLRILKVLQHDYELCVSDLSTILDASISSTSQHLKLLESAGLVSGERMGQTICYKRTQSNPLVEQIMNYLT